MLKRGVSLPRLVVVTRASPIAQLRARHGTTSQAAFYLKSRKQKIDTFEEQTARLEAGIQQVLQLLPTDRRRARVDRDELDRFLFEPEDIVFAVGQDGLVANVAKYLSNQPIIGINPDRARYDGVLCRLPPDEARGAMVFAETGVGPYSEERRTLAVAEREDGQKQRALNEVFIGHKSHQSARYILKAGGHIERHSSSGILVSTGTGATGWARSVAAQRGLVEKLPTALENRLVFLVREPFPSVATGTKIDFGLIEPGASIEVISEMGEDGVIFADGIESDRMEFTTGQRVIVRADETPVRLIGPAKRRR
ncbi:hypothetical protein LBMAG42_47920 [Deltaproteobacteria bacterium]|nr:hypothetical protein LBMAG42_47920 [Deltaproteobacteria bacterium]